MDLKFADPLIDVLHCVALGANVPRLLAEQLRQVLMRALRDFNTPKIPDWDIPIFKRLISDLFPQFWDCTPRQWDEKLKTVAKRSKLIQEILLQHLFMSRKHS